MGFRFYVLAGLFSILFAGLGFKLWSLQIEHAATYTQKAQAELVLNEQHDLQRGSIFFTDTGGEDIPVALDQSYPYIYADPVEVKNATATADAAAVLLGMPAEDIFRQLTVDPNSQNRILINRATQEEVDAINGAKSLTGIHVGTKFSRNYPFGSLGAHILGFVGLNAAHPVPAGLYGVEKLHDATLAAEEDLDLTIDRNVQSEAEQVLAKVVADRSATGGSIIVMDPMTGKILALANMPTYDPRTYKDFPVGDFLDSAVESQYEPGSVMKSFTMAAGIDTGKITTSTTYVDTGSVTLNGKTIHNAEPTPFGRLTMTNVIEHSVNTGAVFAEQQMGNAIFYHYLKQFGFGDVTGVDLPGEIPGTVKNLESRSARAVDFANAAFGQGVGVTPMQLVVGYSALANGGLLMRPYLNAEEKPTVVRRVVSTSTAAAVVGMIESAVNVNSLAVIPGYRIAGKTGTAQIPDLVNGGYSQDLEHTFIGLGPVSAPRFVVLVKIDKPQGVGLLAGLTVVPAFHDIATYLLNYYSVPPDKVPATATP